MAIPGGIRARLALALLAVVAIASLGAYLMVIPSLERRLVDAKLKQLASDAEKASPFVAERALTPGLGLDRAVAGLDELYSARVVVFDVFGPPPTLQALSDSAQTGTDALLKDGVALETARTGRITTGRTRRGGREYAEAAVPLVSGEVLLFSSPLVDQLSTVSVIERRLLYATVVALGIALALGSAAAALHARRIRGLERAAERIAGGRFDEAIVDERRDELGELARSFDRMRVQLKVLDDARKEFVANASHELRTPLFSLAGFLELLADEELDDETRRGFLQTTREQVSRLTTLATDLLDLSRLDAGQMRLEQEEVALDEVLHSVADELGPIAEASGHTIEVDASPGTVALADEERVIQVARALARNAVVHSPPGSHVVLRAWRGGARAIVAIEDDGPGIPPEHVEHVFQRFYRVEGARASGSGLGLAIARELVDRMGGTLAVRSRPGATAFVIELPGAGGRAPVAAGSGRRTTD